MHGSIDRAVQLLNEGRAEEALPILKTLKDQGQAPFLVRRLFAGALLLLDRKDEALRNLEDAAQMLPRVARPAEARMNLAPQFAAAGAFDEADKLMAEAMALEPGNLEAVVRRADLNANNSHWREALDLYRAALKQLPDHPAILASAGIAAHNAGEIAAAIDHYKAALARDPGQVDIYNNLLAALLGEGRADEAREYCRQWLQIAPADIEAMAFMSLLDIETGRGEAAQPWFDYDRLVQTHVIEPPAGYADLESFNRALEKQVLAQSNLETPPEDHLTWHHPALRIGRDINEQTEGPILDLEALMHEGVKRYFECTGEPGGHPFLTHRPESYSIAAWSAVLDGEGNQKPHIHKSGYLSGCYYVTIPPEVTGEENGADGTVKGGFEVGRPPQELPFGKDFPMRTIKPQEGLMVLFPAYLYHGTIPFKSDKRRISIAFDVIPQPASA